MLIMVNQLDNSAHALHPHHLECPRCGHHQIVVQNDNRYICLNCNWQRNVSEEWPPLPWPLAIILPILLALLIL